MNIRIKKRSQNEWIVMFIFAMPLLFAPLLELLSLPSIIKYTVDIAWVFILLTMLLKRKCSISRDAKMLERWIIAFLFYCIINYAFNYQSLFYFMWGLRNNFRFYVFFMACIYYIRSDDIDNYLKIIDKLFYVNFVVILIQYFVLGFKQDLLGGIFGTQVGCNGWLNIFQVIVVAYSLLSYLNKRAPLKDCICKCGGCLIIAAFAELKFFFAEFIIILILSVVFTKFSWKKILIIIGAGVGLYVSVNVMVSIFPSMAEVMSIQGFFESAASEKGYTSSGDINRLTVLSVCSQRFLDTPILRLFGFGLGNCDYAEGFAFLTSPFYKLHEAMHYTWLSTAFMYLEEGYIGLIFYFGFFVSAFWMITKRKKNVDSTNVFYFQIAQVIAVMCIVIGIYNSSLRLESGYIMYFLLAIPFIKEKGYEYKTEN